MYFHKHPKNSPPYHNLWSRRGGFSLVEVMVAVGLSAGVIYALTTLIQYSFEDVAHYKDKESSTNVHRHFSKQWSSILKKSGLSPHFLKVSVDINPKNSCIEFKEDEGGPCVFSFIKETSSSSCIGDIPREKLDRLRKIAKKLKPKIEGRPRYINMFKDEWLHTIQRPLTGTKRKSKKENQNGKPKEDHPKVLTYHQATIPPKLHSSKNTRYFVGWKLAEKHSFPLLLDNSRLDNPVRFNFSSFLGKADPILEDKNDEGKYIIQSTRPLDEDEHDKLDGHFILFHDKSDPRIYTLKIIEELKACNKDNCPYTNFFNKSKAAPKIQERIDNNDPTIYHYVKFKEDKKYYTKIKRYIKKEYIKKIDNNNKIKWFNEDKIISFFPLNFFSLSIENFKNQYDEGKKIFKSKGKGAKNIYRTAYSLGDNAHNNSKSSITGLPVQFVTIDLKKHPSSKSDDTKRYKLVKTIHTPGNNKIKHTTVLIPSLVVEQRPRGKRRTPRKEHILIGRQFGSQNISVFFTDLRKKSPCFDEEK